MYTHRIIYKHLFLATLATLILGNSIAAHANVIYQYTSALTTVSQDLNNPETIVATDRSLIDGTFGAPFSGRWTASLTFASALAPSSTTALHAESGRLGLGQAETGGVLHYLGTGLGNDLKIVDDIYEYKVGDPLEGTLDILNYSELHGNVTTDAAGNISAWNLSYMLHRVNDGFGGRVWVGPDQKPDGFPDPSLSNLEMGLFLSSEPFEKSISEIDFLNGVFQSPPTAIPAFDAYDDAFWDRNGPTQVHFFTGERGSFTTIQQAPIPGTLALLVAATLAWLTSRATQRRRTPICKRATF
jgi:hypothetical protein